MQYMVVDYKLFKPYHSLPPGLLWVVEQMPGLVVGGAFFFAARRQHACAGGVTRAADERGCFHSGSNVHAATGLLAVVQRALF